MKKIYKFAIALIILTFALGSAAFADSGRIADQSGILNKEEKSAMEKRLDNLSDKYDFDIAVIVSDDADAEENAETFVSESDSGKKDGIVLSFRKETGDFCILPFGEGAEIFDAETLSQIQDEIKPYFEKEKFYEGFNVYIRQAERQLEGAKGGGADNSPVDYKARSKRRIITIAASLIAAVFVAMVVTYSMRNSLEKGNVYKKEDFSDPVLKITGREDVYLKSEEEEL